MNKTDLMNAQATQLEIALEIKRICEKNEINYFLDGGTLLGAVRHKGFIPWDDDFDMGMLYEDYCRFLSVLPSDLNDRYFLQSWDTDEFYPAPYIKIRKKGTSYKEKKSSPKAKDGVWVDIFPYIPFNGSFDEENRVAGNLMKMYRTLLVKCKYKPWEKDNGTNFIKYLAYIPYRLFSIKENKDTLKEKYFSYLMQFRSLKSEKLLFDICAEPNAYYLETEWYSKFIYLEFERHYFLCPVGYDKVLKSFYGNYMELPPVDQRENRHIIINPKF